MPDFDFGKYAVYIWAAYALTAAVFAWLVLGALSHARKWKRRAEALGRR